MPSPVSPTQFKALIPSVNGNFCQKFLALLDFPNLFYTWYASVYLESGEFQDDFVAQICALDCTGTGGGGGGGIGLAAPLLSASDGGFVDKIQLIWNAIAGATVYDVYRATSNNSSTATLLVHDLTGTIYDDTTVTPGLFYYYWVKARNQTETSDFSNGDRGNAGAIQSTLAPVTDLVAGQGIGVGGFSTSPLVLVFTPAVGAESYDIYRNSIDSFATATLIDSQRIPIPVIQPNHQRPIFTDNEDHLVYYHEIESDPTFVAYVRVWYFWVVARRSSPAATSQPSNNGYGAKGWLIGSGDQVIPGATVSPGVVVAGYTKAWVVLNGAGAAGAGGDLVYGGGGGGDGAIVSGLMNVVAGAAFRLVVTPPTDTVDTPSLQNGADGSLMILQYSLNGTFSDAVEVCRSGVPLGGQYNAAGGGLGGAAGVGANSILTSAKIYAGYAGRPGDGRKGGSSGAKFGHARLPGAHYDGYGLFSFPGSTGGHSGSGAYASPFLDSHAMGGRGGIGFCHITYKV